MVIKETQGRGGRRPGSGRKAKDAAEKAVTVAICLPLDLVQKLDAISAAEQKSRSKVILEFIQKNIE